MSAVAPAPDEFIVGNGLLVTVDRERRIFRNGAVHIRNGRIVAVDRSEALQAALPGVPFRDAGGAIVLPGLVDAHVHVTESIMRGFGLDIPILPWIRDRLRPAEEALTDDDIAAAVDLSLYEFLRSGITTFVESLFPANEAAIDGAAAAILASGLRGHLSVAYTTHADEAAIRRAHARWHGQDGRIDILIGLRPPAATPNEVSRAAGRLARDLGTRLSWHFQPVKGDPGSMTGMADHLGLLWPGTLLGHAFGLTADDIGTLARCGASVVTLPATNTRLAMGSCPVPELLAAGVPVALGTDGDNVHDLLRTLSLTASIHKSRSGDATVLPVETLIEMATREGARALGLEHEIGSLEVGKRADLVLLGTGRPALLPLGNPLGSIVYGACAADVTAVIVEGKILLEAGVPTRCDPERIMRTAEIRSPSLLTRAGLQHLIGPRWPLI